MAKSKVEAEVNTIENRQRKETKMSKIAFLQLLLKLVNPQIRVVMTKARGPRYTKVNNIKNEMRTFIQSLR